jgi:hypothetical protein
LNLNAAIRHVDLITNNLKRFEETDTEGYNIHVGARIFMDLENKRDLVEQGWKVKKYIPKVRRKSAP